MMDNLPTWVYVILALFAGLFGNQFLGKYIERLQVQRQSVESTITQMVQTQSAELVGLLKEALKANQVMANNIGQLAATMEGHGRDGHNQFLLVKQSLDTIASNLGDMSKKLDTTNDYTAAVIRAIGGNLEALVTDVQTRRDREKALQEGKK